MNSEVLAKTAELIASDITRSFDLDPKSRDDRLALSIADTYMRDSIHIGYRKRMMIEVAWTDLSAREKMQLEALLNLQSS
jgi:hypothetical protein